MEEEINRVPIVRNELLANNLESNNGEIDNFPSRNLSFQTNLSQSVLLSYPSRTRNPLKLPQSSRKNDIKLETNASIVQWNINGLRNHIEELKILTKELGPTIVCLQETTLNWKNHRRYVSRR
jgi:hypothetical protein